MTIEHSDISDETSDVIVNTTSENISHSDTAVANAILSKGGPALKHQCTDLVAKGLLLGYGDIKITLVEGFGQLKCKWLIHSHLPGRSNYSYSIIHHIVTKCLEEAEKKGMKSIALPVFGFGNGGYALEEAAVPMFEALMEFGVSSPRTLEKIKIVIQDHAKFTTFCDYFSKFFKLEAPGIIESVSSYVVSKFTGKAQSKPVDLSSLDPSLFQNLGNSLVLFKVYAPSLKVCEDIIKTLKEHIKEKCLDEPIENSVIEKLTDIDIKLIQMVGSGKVHIQIFDDINNIRIIGERTDVIEARSKIIEILTEVEKVHAGLERYHWKYFEDDGIKDYTFEESCILEKSYIKKLNEVKLVIDGVDCLIDLQKFEEISCSGTKVRKVKREEKHKYPGNL